jgi:hypothetical protein
MKLFTDLRVGTSSFDGAEQNVLFTFGERFGGLDGHTGAGARRKIVQQSSSHPRIDKRDAVNRYADGLSQLLGHSPFEEEAAGARLQRSVTFSSVSNVVITRQRSDPWPWSGEVRGL